jgi:hypothetical protein
MTFIRWRVEHPLLFLILHIGLTGWPLLLPFSVAWRAVLFPFMLISAAYSILIRLTNGWRAEASAVYVCVGADVILMFVADYFKFQAVNGILSFWAFVAVLAHLAYTQTLRVDRTLDILSAKARQPVGTILRFNNIIIILFLALAGAAAMLSGIVPLQRVGTLVIGLVLWVIRQIARLINMLLPDSSSPPAEAPPNASPAAELMPMERGETSQFWHMLEQIFLYLINILLVAAVLFGIGYLIYRFYRKFHITRREDGDLREYLGPEPIFENISASLRSFFDHLPFSRKSDRERVRREYYQTIKKHIRRGVPVQASDTTGQIQEKLLSAEDIAELTGRYDRARYSRGG